MADENKKPEDEPTPNEVAAESQSDATLETESGEEIKATPEYSDGQEGDKLPEAENVLEEGVADALNKSEELADTPPVEAFDSAVKSTMDAMESVADAPHHDTTHAAHSDVVVLPYFGERTMPGGIYTAVFIGLAILTVAEVLIAEIFGYGFFRIFLLLAIALGKSALVVMYYMHLKDDSKVFLAVLLVPLLVTLLSVLFLLGVPIGGGLGYS